MEFTAVMDNSSLQLGLRARDQMNLILVIKQNIMTVQTQEPLADEVSRYLATLT